jgi:hypothetical protein
MTQAAINATAAMTTMMWLHHVRAPSSAATSVLLVPGVDKRF